MSDDASPSPPAAWRIGPDRRLSLDRPRLMGILNVTPDSFSDGGRHASVDAAVAYALEMVEEGADIVDVGGASTRPGAAPVDSDEQRRRVIPVVEALRRRTDVAVSVDTTLRAVAVAALDAGADIVNDVSAGTEDPALLEVVAERGAGVVLMHRRRPPDEERYSDEYDRPPAYDDVVADVAAWLEDRCAAAERRGVPRDAIVIDPGLGFGKTVDQNLELVRRTAELAAGGRPLLSAASRKSFLGAVTGVDRPHRRGPGSVAVSVAHWLAGVRLFRVHDVSLHREALAVAAAVTPARAGA
ncbi:MAG: dihydropteroate synthase [Planctomycetota bacterium]|jgi:dihydropteroate synthase